MNQAQIEAYEWARQQDYPSVAARYAKILSGVVNELQAQLAERGRELKRLQKEVVALAIESVEREKTLARLEAEVMAAIEPKRGEWIRMDETQALLSVEWKCSQCEQEIRVDSILAAIGAGWKYCPNCGAKMESEGNQ